MHILTDTCIYLHGSILDRFSEAHTVTDHALPVSVLQYLLLNTRAQGDCALSPFSVDEICEIKAKVHSEPHLGGTRAGARIFLEWAEKADSC